MTRWTPKTPGTALNAMLTSRQHFARMIKRGAKGWSLRPKDRRILRAIMGLRGCSSRMSLADVGLHSMALKKLLPRLQEHREARGGAKQAKYYLATFIPDKGRTSDRVPVFSVRAFHRQIEDSLRSAGLSGIVVMEIQAITNAPGKGLGRTLMFNAHAIVWADGPFNRRSAVKELNASSVWRCADRLKGVRIDTVTKAEGQLEYLAYYLLKLPHEAKVARMHTTKGGKVRPHLDTIKKYRPDLGLRIVEGLSQIGWTEAVFSVGSGKDIAGPWLAELKKWHAQRFVKARALTNEFDVPAFWRRIQQDRKRGATMQPFNLRPKGVKQT